MKWLIATWLFFALASHAIASPTCTPSSPVGLPCTTGTITYDGAGSISAIGNDAFRYDPFGRLASATLQSAAGTGQSYEYDSVGNLTKITYTLDGAPTTAVIDNDTNATTNHLAGATYDDAGSVTGISGMAFNYDPSGMMTSASGNGYTLEIYTADDERIGTMQVSAPITGTKINLKPYVATWRIRGIAPQVLRELKENAPASGVATWTWVRDWAYRGNHLLAEMLPLGANSAGLRHYHLDHLGTPRLITDESGSKISVHHYYPYGEEITPIAGQTEVTKFTGHERDFIGGTLTENKQYVDYMHARFGRPVAGRFLSVDPSLDAAKNAAEPQRWNRYAYVQNNPVDATDPDGRETFKINRELGGHRARSPYNPVTHTFIATTSGGVIRTYSWGNTPDQFTENKWNENKPEDQVAAKEALDKGLAQKLGDDSLDPYVKQAFEVLKKDPDSDHFNYGLVLNCKFEAMDLLNLAKKYQAQDEKEKKKQTPAPTEEEQRNSKSARPASTCVSGTPGCQ